MTEEQIVCPVCGCDDCPPLDTTYMGHDVFYYVCSECKKEFGGDLD